MSAVDELRAAAARMRALAEAATPRPWEAWSGASAGGGEYVSSREYTFGISPGLSGETGFKIAQRDAQHIAAWNPVVALAVAEWLEATADRVGSHSWTGSPSALKVARAFMRNVPQEGQRRGQDGLGASE